MARKSTKTHPKHLISQKEVHSYLDNLFQGDIHAKRVLSISNTVTGVLRSSSLSVSAIGRGLAMASGMMDKHAIKQVDRLLSNQKLDVDACSIYWIPMIVGKQTEIFCNLDWTEFDKDKHSTLILSLQTNHGRSLPLLWKTYWKSELKDKRNDYEDEMLAILHDILVQDKSICEELKVTIVADRGFGDTLFFWYIKEKLGFDYIIRIRGNTWVSSSKGIKKKSSDWTGKDGRMKILKSPKLTLDEIEVPGFLAVRDKNMKENWCLVFSDTSKSGSTIKKRYGKRFSCEETHRDFKSLRFGMGMKWTSIKRPDRRDRVLFVATIAHTLISLLGAAGERCGLDRILKPNTSKKRLYSLFRQGMRWFELIPNMPKERLLTLMIAYEQILAESSISTCLWRVA